MLRVMTCVPSHSYHFGFLLSNNIHFISLLTSHCIFSMLDAVISQRDIQSHLFVCKQCINDRISCSVNP
jgi:hypothetical protein